MENIMNLLDDFQKTCCFSGHRPEKCKGSEPDVRKRLSEEIQKAINDGYLLFITGMALGVDIWAAEEILKIKSQKADIKLICAIPFEGVEKSRTLEQQNRFREILEKSDYQIYICPTYKRWCFHARDEWMVDHASRVIAVFNGASGGTEFTINYAKKNKREVILVIDEE